MVKITNQQLASEDIYRVAFHHEKVTLSETVRKKVTKTRQQIEKAIEKKEIIYGVTTGFGAFKNTVINQEKTKQLQENLILSHAVGVGEPLREDTVRGIMFIIVNYLSKGHSGVRLQVIETLIAMINKNVIPVVPEKGSVGSSGDLAPSSHIILVVIGKGEAYFAGKRMPGSLAMKKAGITPLKLEAKEGLALINNTATMLSVGIFALQKAKLLTDVADIIASLSAQALFATDKAFDERIHKLKAHEGQIITAKRLRTLLNNSNMLDRAKVQDQYSIRCIPQIHGAVREALSYVEKIVNTEINSVTDNPLIFENPDGTIDVLSGGNFHGEPVAIAMDTLSIAIAELGNIADRRLSSLLDPATNNGLPAFLSENGGVNSGLMIVQYTTASLVSENKVLAHPASVDSIPTSANVEDLVSMGTIAARKALTIVENVEQVLAIELLAACQAIDFRLKQGYKLSPTTKPLFNQVRTLVPYFSQDSLYYPYFAKLISLITSGKFVL